MNPPSDTAGPASRRLFFALWPGADTRRAIQKACRAAVRKCGSRPVAPRNYHITLAFLGNQPADRFEPIVAAGGKVAAHQAGVAFELRLDRLRFWSRAHVLLLAASENPPTLLSLANELWCELEPLGIERDRRALLPHVTLCRKVQKAPEVDLPGDIHWIARDFVLVESVTDPAGAIYTVVARFPAEPSSPG